MAEKKKTLFERIVHRARRSKRERWFSDLGIKVGDTVEVTSLDGRKRQLSVVDLDADNLWRRFVIARNGHGMVERLRADGRIHGYTIAKAD